MHQRLSRGDPQCFHNSPLWVRPVFRHFLPPTSEMPSSSQKWMPIFCLLIHKQGLSVPKTHKYWFPPSEALAGYLQVFLSHPIIFFSAFVKTISTSAKDWTGTLKLTATSFLAEARAHPSLSHRVSLSHPYLPVIHSQCQLYFTLWLLGVGKSMICVFRAETTPREYYDI